jgi:hypothetical protein
VFLPDTSKGTRVSFAEVLVTDGLTSLSKVLADIEVIVCFILAHIRYVALLINLYGVDSLQGPFRLAKKSEFVNAEFVYLFPTRGLINWFLKLALMTVSMSSPYFFAGGTG